MRCVQSKLPGGRNQRSIRRRLRAAVINSLLGRNGANAAADEMDETGARKSGGCCS